MTGYTYRAIDQQGKEIKGTIEATSKQHALNQLKERSLFPVSVEEQNLLNKDIALPLSQRVTVRELSIFCKQFSSILGAGVTLLTALELLGNQSENKVMKKAILDIYASVEKGDTLAGAMGRYPKVFPSILINMVAAGETSGSLEISFERMAIHFEKEKKLKQTIKKATTYPLIVATVAVLVVLVLVTFVVPNFVVMFDTMNMELPGTTKLLINTSDFILQKWYIIGAILVLIIIGLAYFKKTPTGLQFFGRLKLRMPLIGKLTIKVTASRFSRTLATLLSAGVSLLEALEIVAKVVDNHIIAQGILTAREQVERGVPLSKPIKDMGLFPPLVTHMLKIGEDTGAMESVMEKVADFYDDEVETSVVQLTTLLEPAIIVVLALVVGFVIISIITPMFQMYEGIGNY